MKTRLIATLASTLCLSFTVTTAYCSIAGANRAYAQSSDASLAQELANPIANLISVPFVTNYDDGYGTGDGYKVFTNLQPLIPLELNKDWNLISRTIIPIVCDQNDIGPLGASGHQSGLGDTLQSLWLSPQKPKHSESLGNIVWGVGPAISLPTGDSDPLLGTGKWGLGPTAVALIVKGGWTYGALTNHIWDFAGKDNRGVVSVTLVQPFVAYTTTDAVTVALESEATYDWITDQWSIPINATVSKLTTIGQQKVSLEAGLRYWADSPTEGPDDLGYRLSMTFLFPK